MSGQPSLKDAWTFFGQRLLGIIDEIIDLRTLLRQTVHLLNRDVLFAGNLPEELAGVYPPNIELSRQVRARVVVPVPGAPLTVIIIFSSCSRYSGLCVSICDTGMEQTKYQ